MYFCIFKIIFIFKIKKNATKLFSPSTSSVATDTKALCKPDGATPVSITSQADNDWVTDFALKGLQASGKFQTLGSSWEHILRQIKASVGMHQAQAPLVQSRTATGHQGNHAVTVVPSNSIWTTQDPRGAPAWKGNETTFRMLEKQNILLFAWILPLEHHPMQHHVTTDLNLRIIVPARASVIVANPDAAAKLFSKNIH